MATVVINADFRDPDRLSFAYLEEGGEVVVLNEPNAFVDYLQDAVTEGKRIVHFNGVSYIFSNTGLLGVCSADRRGSVRSIALQSVDIMVAFFLDHGYPVAWRRIEVVTSDYPKGNIPFLSPVSSEDMYTHNTVLKGIAAIVKTLEDTKRLRWLPKSRTATKRAKTSCKTWVPESVPAIMTVQECMRAWERLETAPNAWMADTGGPPPMTMVPSGEGRSAIPACILE